MTKPTYNLNKTQFHIERDGITYVVMFVSMPNFNSAYNLAIYVDFQTTNVYDTVCVLPVNTFPETVTAVTWLNYYLQTEA